MKSVLKNNKKILIILSWIFFTILVLYWFRGVDFFGGGEESIGLWRPGVTYNLYKSTWIDVGLGFASPFLLPRVPLYLIASFANLVLNPRTLQILFFSSSMFFSFLGVFLLVKRFVKDSILVAVIAGVFYIFNLFTLSQVFSRFVFSGIVFWSFLPLFIYLAGVWLEDGRWKHLILFLLVSVIFSHAYSHPAFILGLWIVGGVLLASLLLGSKDKRLLLKRFLILFTLWLIVNIWWIYPMGILKGTVEQRETIRGWQYDFSTLEGLSRDFGNLDIFLLRQKYYFDRSLYWGEFYTSLVAYGLSLLAFFFTLAGLFRKKFVKKKAFFTLLFITGWFLVKGVNPPFGNVFYKNLFNNFSTLGVLRNPYEKLGAIFLLPYSIFFSVGVVFIINKLRSKTRILFSGLLVFLISGLLAWPMWIGRPFSPDAAVSVPEYYSSANEFLNTFEDDARILSLPMSDYGAKYEWEGGDYLGKEPSDILFDRRTVGRAEVSKESEQKRKELKSLLENDEFPAQIVKDMGIKYIIVHGDVDESYSNAQASEDIKLILDESSQVEHLKKIGKLDIYRTSWDYKGFVSVSSSCDSIPLVNYDKLSAREYQISLKKVECPVRLILKNSYHDFWQASVGSEKLSDHFIALGYANGWLINKPGNYDVRLLFKVWPWE